MELFWPKEIQTEYEEVKEVIETRETKSPNIGGCETAQALWTIDCGELEV